MDDKITRYYDQYDEEGRLMRSYIQRLEYETNLYQMKKYLRPGMKVLDGCAGTGRYAFALAQWGCQVWAGDLTASNVEAIRSKDSGGLENIFVNDVISMPDFAEASFDAVLCMGAFYHLDEKNRKAALEECLRVLRPDGILMVTYINRAGVAWLEVMRDITRLDEAASVYRAECFEEIFYPLNCLQLETLMENNGAEVLTQAVSEGPAVLLGEKLDKLTEEQFQEYLKFHLKTCEDRTVLGMGIHGILIGRKSGVKTE